MVVVLVVVVVDVKEEDGYPEGLGRKIFHFKPERISVMFRSFDLFHFGGVFEWVPKASRFFLGAPLFPWIRELGRDSNLKLHFAGTVPKMLGISMVEMTVSREISRGQGFESNHHRSNSQDTNLLSNF